mmetsp:Transcript_34993/g.46994  ORF Transcript_34993/g.46994 Transcript_34993/m.46994 type:complete len:149 (-) Transcript_34993:102-548(-)
MRRNVPRCGINNRDVAVDDVSFAFPWNLSRLRDVGYCIFRAERAIFRQNELLFWQLWFYLWCLVKCVGAFVWGACYCVLSYSHWNFVLFRNFLVYCCSINVFEFVFWGGSNKAAVIKKLDAVPLLKSFYLFLSSVFGDLIWRQTNRMF